jgi:hypothetical protein
MVWSVHGTTLWRVGSPSKTSSGSSIARTGKASMFVCLKHLGLALLLIRTSGRR